MSTVRERIRAETVDEIKAVALRQLEQDGATMSLRAIARELGMVSSAIYRYFASRDDLLTALIIDGYTALAEQVEVAESLVDRASLAGRFGAVGHAVRNWARAHRAEYALLYGSPVPGYVAPQETVVPVVRMTVVLFGILRDGVASGELTVDATETIDPGVRVGLEAVMADTGQQGVPAAVVARGFTAWAALFGVISFELFGHSVGITQDYDALFVTQLDCLNRMVGLR